jgi:hypothetical protein
MTSLEEALELAARARSIVRAHGLDGETLARACREIAREMRFAESEKQKVIYEPRKRKK